MNTAGLNIFAAFPPRCCVDRHLLAPRRADRLAAQKNALWTHPALDASGKVIWRPGDPIRIAFAGGTRADRASVMRAASEWMRYTSGLRIVQVNSGFSELRCSFDQMSGSWSYIGQECFVIPRTQPTMNMGWRGDYGRDLHEMGHALGLIHEHQSPAAKIPWNKPAVYAYYGGAPNYWTREEVDQQLFARYDDTLITNSSWDGKSCMQYPIPREHVLDPRFVVGMNTALSMTDKTWIAKVYQRS